MNRLKEASTWAGFGVFFQVMKSFAPQYGAYLDVASGIAASIATITPDAAHKA